MGFFGDFIDKLKDTGEKAGNVLALPVGATLDLARYATPLDDSFGPDWLSAKKALPDAADLLIGENTLTGWSVSQAGEKLNTAYRYGLEDNFEALGYHNAAWLHGDPISWGDSYKLARERNIGESSLLIANQNLSAIGDKVGLDTSAAVRSIPLVGSYLEEAGVGADETKDIKASDEEAWDEFHSKSPFWSGVLASGIDITAQFYADPFLAASKATQVPRALRNTRPILEGEEVGLAERMATEKTHNILGIPSKKAGLQSRTDPLIGTIKYEDHIVDGQAVTDADDVKQLVAVADKAGWLDGKSTAQVYVGLNLKTHPYGDQIASLLSRTNEVKNPATKVNIRRDILASMGGDAAATARLAHAEDYKEFAYTLSNTYRGKGTGELAAALADDAKAADITAGKAAPALTEPDVVSGVVDELHAQSGFPDWLYATMKDRTLVASPKGNRALKRLAGEGLNNRAIDQIVSDKILGRFKPNGSLIDDAIMKSDELAEGVAPAPASLAGGKVYQADQVPFSRGPNSMPATVVRGGMKIAGWATGITPASKVAGKTTAALRRRVVQGALNVEDAPLSIAVTQGFLEQAGVEASRADTFLSSVINASTPTQRAVAVQKAQDEAINTLANRYGVDKDLIARIHLEHGARKDATMAALRGQSYSAHTKIGPDGKLAPGDVAYLPDEAGTMVLPLLDTQTINNMPLLDLDYVEKWLKRDKMLSAVGSKLRNVGSNPQAKRATEMGFNSRITENLETQSDRWIRFLAEETNSWWKRGVLLTRAPSYAMRNTIEEMMRVASIGHTAVTTDAAVRQANHRLRDFARRHGNKAAQDLAPDHARLELRKAELEDVRDLHDDPDIIENVKAIRTELRSLRTKRTRAANAGEDTADLDSAISYVESMPALVEHADWADQVTALEREVAALEKALAEAVLPESGTHLVAGVEMPQAFHGVGGRQAYDRVAGGGTFDRDVTQFGDSTFARRRGVGEPSIISVSHPSANADELARHAQAWGWILNKQIRQDEAARVALDSMAQGQDDVARRVQSFLDSPAGAKYRKNNPHRAHDTEEWANDIADMIQHHVPSQNLAQRLLDGEVSKPELLEGFPEATMRPDVHPAGIDGLFGFGSRKLAQMATKMFRGIDKMSVNAITRHPLYTAFFQEEQSRLAQDFLRKAHIEGGEGATLSLDDINTIADRSRKVAETKVRQTFYDTSSRSSAAQKLRFMYPFFAAHQDSMTFWGRAIAQNPNVLRKLQLAFQVPASLGLVVDRDGNPVEPGEFIASDHMILLQVPKAWGGPDPQDPTAKQTGFRLQLSAANLITQNGSILNPGAGPMAAIPAGYVARRWGATNDDISKAMTWFNPYGAPKTGDNPALPGALQGLDPALPTPLKRIATLIDAHNEKHSREYTEMYALRFTEAQVKFYEENDRPPNSQEARVIEKTVAEQVKKMALLRAITSIGLPMQPQPNSRMQGFIDEFRRLQEQGRRENRGPLWAADTFLNRFGDEYIALTKSSAENRAGINASSAAVRSLQAHEGLTDKTTPETWRLIVGGEGEGAFSIDAYRWMQAKSVGPDGDKLIDKKEQHARLFDVNVAAGWRAYNKAINGLQAVATSHGFKSVDQSPELRALRSDLLNELETTYPDWAANRANGSDFESELWPSIQVIAQDKRLLNDPARSDIRTLGEYVKGRQAVQQVLAQRLAAGESGNIDANANADVALAYGLFIAELTENNTVFSDYAVPGIISRDPLYRPELLDITAPLATSGASR